MKVDRVIKEFSITYNSDIGLLNILVDYFDKQNLQNSLIKDWVNITRLLLKGSQSHKFGRIYLFNDNYYKGNNILAIEISLKDIDLQDLQEKEVVKKDYDYSDDYDYDYGCGYWHYYNGKEFTSELKILLDSKINFSLLRRLLFEFFRDEKIYNHIYEIEYTDEILIDKVNIYKKYAYYNYENYKDYWSYYKLEVNNNEIIEKRWKGRLNEIEKLLDEYKKENNINTFKLIREAIGLKKIKYILELLT